MLGAHADAGAVRRDLCVPSTSNRRAPRASTGVPRRQVRRQARDTTFSLFKEGWDDLEDDHADAFRAGVIAGVRTLATPRLTPEKVFSRLYETLHNREVSNYGAFYSSELGGITTDPACFLVRADDHMLHHGHGVCETVAVVDGYIYLLHQHIERLRASATAAGIPLPASVEGISRIVLDTAAASQRLNGLVHVYISAGRGSFGLDPTECIGSILYVAATGDHHEVDRTIGWTAITVKAPCLPPEFTAIRSTSQLLHVMAMQAAIAQGVNTAILVDTDGYVLHSVGNSGVGIVTQQDVIVTPSTDGQVECPEMARLLEVVKDHDDKDLPVRSVEQRPIAEKELKEASEVFMVNASNQVVPITKIDDHKYGKLQYVGKPGLAGVIVNQMFLNDMAPKEGSPFHVAVPYGYLTGMKEQLI